MSSSPKTFATLLASFLLAGCGSVSDVDGELADASAMGASIDAQTVCDEQDFAIERQPTRLMLALDMSGSMIGKYNSARNGITNAITNLDGLFHFGFNSYPQYPYTAQCTIAPDALYDTLPGNEAGILSWLTSNVPRSGAGDPLVVQMDALLAGSGYANNFTSPTMPGEAYLVVVSDGDDCCGPGANYSCGNEWSAELVQRTEQLLVAGIKTVVVGYTGADDATMTAIAQAGGSPFDTYLPANDETALQTALETIGAALVSCSFGVEVPDSSADPEAVNLYADGELLPFEPGCTTGTGWDWADAEHTAVKLCAGPCDDLRAETIQNVKASFGCPSVQID